MSDSRLRLVIGFTDDRFTDTANLTRRTQELRTTATLNSGEILVMGGLLRVDNIDKGSYTPILGHVPIFGSFFRGTQAQTVTTNVTLFVMPTILEPRSRWIAKTNDYICDSKNFVTRTEIPAMLRDPIYRLHFRNTSDQQMVDQFIAQGTHRYRCQDLRLMQKLPDESAPPYDPHALKQILGRKKLCIPLPPKP